MKYFIASLMLVGFTSFANVPSTTIETESTGNPETVRPLEDCYTNIFPVWDRQGSRCSFRDEAMVGIKSFDPLVIQCGKINVRCNGRPEVESVANSKEGAK